MKTSLTIRWRRVLGALTGVLGFGGCFLTSCAKMYGCPSTDYKLVGDVKDVRRNPIPGIRVVFDRFPEDKEYGKDTLYTDQSGHFEKDLPDAYWNEGSIVKFEDVDGSENGSFRTKVLSNDELEFKQTKKGDGKWYSGAFDVRADAVLEDED